MKRIFSAIVCTMVLFTLPLQARAAELLIPVGKIIGLQLLDDAVTVAAYDETWGAGAREAGLKIGDEIVAVDGSPVASAQDVRTALGGCGESVALTVRRGSKVSTLRLTPEQTGDGPRLGVYLRQGVAGIGTVTFFDPDTGAFGALGHGVSDARGTLLRLRQGYVYTAQVQAVKKGVTGDPGQLKGSADTSEAFGTLLRNTPQGVFGITQRNWTGEALPVAEFGQIHTGAAAIRSTIQGDSPQDYCVEILKIYPQERSDGRNFLLKVTDPALLASTGGIVQGMSGSPILQDGRLIGAVTHVLVNDPTTGYGIFIENMLDAAA